MIVLSTFWREFAGYIEYILRRHGVAAPVVGRTPGQAGTSSLAHEKPFASRAAEIEAYLAAQASGRPSEPPSVVRLRLRLRRRRGGIALAGVSAAIGAARSAGAGAVPRPREQENDAIAAFCGHRAALSQRA